MNIGLVKEQIEDSSQYDKSLNMSCINFSQITLGIVEHNDHAHLAELFKSLDEIQILGQFASILVVDNFSDSSLSEHFFYKNLQIKIIRTLENNMGLARARVVENVTTPFVLFMDADTRPTELWHSGLSVALDLLDKNLDWAGVGGANISNSDSLTARSLQIAFLNPLVHGYSSQMRPVDSLISVRNLSTCNALYRIQDLRLAGNFSASFCTTGEDLEISCRVKNLNKSMYMIPNFEVHHIYPVSKLKLAKKFFKWGQAQMPVFYRHPRSMLSSVTFKMIVIFGALIFAVFNFRLFLGVLLFIEIGFFLSLKSEVKTRLYAFMLAHLVWVSYSLGMISGAFSFKLKTNDIR